MFLEIYGCLTPPSGLHSCYFAWLAILKDLPRCDSPRDPSLSQACLQHAVLLCFVRILNFIFASVAPEPPSFALARFARSPLAPGPASNHAHALLSAPPYA